MTKSQLIKEGKQRIPCKIQYVSSEDRYGSVNDIISSASTSQGWKSAPMCKYPQEIIIEFNERVHLTEIQLISHQFYIATKIEIYYNDIINHHNNNRNSFKKYGYFALKSNEDTNFQLREVKTISINSNLSQIKLSLQNCYNNYHNVNHQVGILSLSFFGEYYKEVHRNNNQIECNGIVQLKKTNDQDLACKLKELNIEKNAAIELEDYDKAKKIKAEIDSLMNSPNDIEKLNKRTSVISDNEYETLVKIQQDIDKVKSQMNEIGLFDRKNKIKQEQIPVQPVDEDDLKNAEKNQSNIDLINNKNEYNNSISNDISIIKSKEKGNDFESKKDNTQINHQLYSYDISKDLCLISNEQFETNDKKQGMIIQNKEKNNTQINATQIKSEVVNLFDEQQIGTHTQDFNELLNEKLNEEKVLKNLGDDSDSDSDNDHISPSLLKQAEDLISVFSYSIVKLILSKKAKCKEKGIRKLIDNISNSKSPLITNQTKEAIQYASMGACTFVLTSKANQPLFASMDLIKLIITTFPKTQLQGFAKTKFDTYSYECTRLLIDHLGHTNKDVQAQAKETLLQSSDYNPIGTKPIYYQLIYNKIKQTLFEKQTCGRMNLINTMINHHNSMPSNISLPDLMNAITQRFVSPMKEIRESALSVIVTIYKYTGDSIREYFSHLKQNQRDIIEESLIKTSTLNHHRNKQENCNTFTINSIMNEKTENNGNDIVNYDTNDNQITQQEEEDASEKNKGLYCQLCYLFDQQLTKDQLKDHYENDCPMITCCPQCNLLIEICGLNFHYTHECVNQKLFKLCQRCKEPVLIDDYLTHITNKNCNPFNPPNLANRCPICHNNITPPGKVGWEIHLLKNKCCNNPRKSLN